MFFPSLGINVLLNDVYMIAMIYAMYRTIIMVNREYVYEMNAKLNDVDKKVSEIRGDSFLGF